VEKPILTIYDEAGEIPKEVWKSSMNEDQLAVWRALLGLLPDDRMYDEVIQSEYRRAVALGQGMSFRKILEVIRGPA